MSDDTGVFQDKKSLSAGILQMEFDLIREYNDIIRRVRVEEVLTQNLNEDENYNVCWQMMAVLYKFLQNKFLAKLKSDNVKEHDALMDIMKDYENEEKVSYVNFKDAFNSIVKTMSLNNFDDVFFKQEEEDDFG